METLTLKQKPLSKNKMRNAGWCWLEENFVAFEKNLRPLVVDVDLEVNQKIRDDVNFQYPKKYIKAVLYHYFQQDIYKKALVNSKYRYELDGTKVKRGVDDLENSRYDN